MNNHIKTGVGIGIVLIVTILVGKFYWMNKPDLKETPVTSQIKTAPQNNETKNQPADIPISFQKQIFYTNEKYNFQMQLPDSWQDYSISEKELGDYTQLNIVLPGNIIPASLLVWKKGTADNCQVPQVCPDKNYTIGQNDDYTIELRKSDQLNDDDQRQLTAQVFESVKKTFTFDINPCAGLEDCRE